MTFNCYAKGNSCRHHQVISGCQSTSTKKGMKLYSSLIEIFLLNAFFISAKLSPHIAFICDSRDRYLSRTSTSRLLKMF